MILHPNAIAEDRSTRERGGWINRKYSDLKIERAEMPDQRARQGALASAGCPGEADGVPLTTQGMREPTDSAAVGPTPFDEGQQPRGRRAIAVTGRGEQLGGIRRARPIRSRSRPQRR